MRFDSYPIRRQLVRDELNAMRRLGRDRRDASTRLPVLPRTGPLAVRAPPASAAEPKDADSRLTGEPKLTVPGNEARPNLLTDEEAVTLRRVAYGESEVKVMRAHDLARLRRLRLIEDAKDGPQLTAAGRAVFDGLPKAMGRDGPKRSDDTLRHMERGMRPKSRR